MNLQSELSGAKSWYQSITVLGGIGTSLTGVLDAIHISHSATLANDVNAWIGAAATVIAGLITVYGRIRATKQIATPSTPTTGQSSALSAIVLLTACTAMLCAGCVVSPRAQWATSRLAMTVAEQNLDVANQSGALSDQDFVATKSFTDATQGALNSADAALTASNDKPNDLATFYLNLASGTLKNLEKLPTKKPSK